MAIQSTSVIRSEDFRDHEKTGSEKRRWKHGRQSGKRIDFQERTCSSGHGMAYKGAAAGASSARQLLTRGERVQKDGTSVALSILFLLFFPASSSSTPCPPSSACDPFHRKMRPKEYRVSPIFEWSAVTDSFSWPTTMMMPTSTQAPASLVCVSGDSGFTRHGKRVQISAQRESRWHAFCDMSIVI